MFKNVWGWFEIVQETFPNITVKISFREFGSV